jgi:putative transposase
MPRKIYQVRLTPEHRQDLLKLINRGNSSARVLTRSRVLLLADESNTDQHIADTLKVSMRTVARVRKRYYLRGIESALYDRPRIGAPAKIKSRFQAHLSALSCSEPPEGHARWTLRLLADKVVELGLIHSISHTEVGKLLKK